MFLFVYGVLFSVNLISYECEGKIIPPPDGTVLTFLPGSSRNITWDFDNDISKLTTRSWTFASSDGLRTGTLGVIALDTSPVVQNPPLPGIKIIKPATLELNNVSHIYDGNYTLSLVTSVPENHASKVTVYIAHAPIVSLSCPSRNEVNEGNDFTCVCRGVGGSPPANVTWYKGAVPISETKKENNTLNLYDVNATDSGTYTCVAQSYPSEAFKDEKSMELAVRLNAKPNNTNISLIPQPVILGGSVEIKCHSVGVPGPDFIINGPNGLNVTGQSHIIENVKKSDEGSYTCIATNALGNDSATDYLNVTESTQTPTSSTIKPSPTQNIVSSTAKRKVSVPTPSREPKSEGTVWFIVIMSLLGVVIIGILLSYIAWRSCRKFRISKHQSNPEPQTTEVDPTYQGLDLNKMNKEDNYQSLTGNYAASNDVGTEDESAYTELKKIRDVEDQYQSLQ